MDIWTSDKLILFIVFVIPGFVSLKVYDLIQPGPRQGTSERLIDAVAYSCVIYALLLIPIVFIENSKIRSEVPWLYYLFYVLVLFVSPVLLALLWKHLRTRGFFLKNAPHPTEKPWDYVFTQREPYWAKVTLKNGTVIGGLYAFKSFASSAPADEQIYLEETWILNDKGGFVRKKNHTEGVLIISDEISHIEFRNYGS